MISTQVMISGFVSLIPTSGELKPWFRWIRALLWVKHKPCFGWAPFWVSLSLSLPPLFLPFSVPPLCAPPGICCSLPLTRTLSLKKLYMYVYMCIYICTHYFKKLKRNFKKNNFFLKKGRKKTPRELLITLLILNFVILSIIQSKWIIAKD